MTGLGNDARLPRIKRFCSRTGVLVAGAALAALPIVCPAVSQAAISHLSQAQTPPDYPPPHWIIQQSAIQLLGSSQLAGYLTQQQLQMLFGNNRTYIDYGPRAGRTP